MVLYRFVIWAIIVMYHHRGEPLEMDKWEIRILHKMGYCGGPLELTIWNLSFTVMLCFPRWCTTLLKMSYLLNRVSDLGKICTDG